MAFGFIWKKQLMWFITLVVVVGLGLSLGAVLHDWFQEGVTVQNDAASGGAPKNDTTLNNAVLNATPSLPFPTTPPGYDMTAPSGNPPGQP